jgi:hypothetical protein
MQILRGTYKGFIENESTNAEFKIRQLEIALSETKEQIGTALLPIFKQFADFLLVSVVPQIEALAAGFTGETGVNAGITEASDGAYVFGERLRTAIEFVISIKDQLLILGTIIAAVFVTNKIIAFVTAIQTIIAAMVALRTAAAAAGIATAFATGGASIGKKLYVGSTVTINGSTMSKTEVDYLTNITPVYAASGKALIFDSNKSLVDINYMNIQGLFDNYKKFIDNIAEYNPEIYKDAVKQGLKQKIIPCGKGWKSVIMSKYNNSYNKKQQDIYYDKYLKYKTKYNQIKNSK